MMAGTTPFMKQLSGPAEEGTDINKNINKNQEKQSAGCGCESTGHCNCPPNQCTCPNCPRDDTAKKGSGDKPIETEKQSTTTTKPGEETFGRKMPYVESASLDVGKPLTLGGALNFAALTQFPSESDRSSVDSSLREPLNSLVEIRDCLVNRLSQGNFNEENIKACADQLDHWEGKYQSKEGVFAASGADFSSKTSQIPKGQEILQQLLHQIRDLHSIIKQRCEQGCIKQAPSVSGGKLSGEASSLMQGVGAGDVSQPQRGTGEVGAQQIGGTGTKKAAQTSELGTERY